MRPAFPLAGTLAGSGRRGRVDGRRLRGAQLDAPACVLALPSGELLVVDGDALRVVSLARDAVYTLATRTSLLQPGGLALIDGGAGLVVADTGHHRLRLLALALDAHSGELCVADDVCLAGTGKPGQADGPAHEATFCRPAGLAVISDGSILVADSGSHAVRRLCARPGLPGLHVSTVVGGGGAGLVDGGPGTARLCRPGALAADAATGTVLVCDAGNRAVRALHPPRDDALLSGAPARELPLGSWALTTLGAVGVLREPAGLLLLPPPPSLGAAAGARDGGGGSATGGGELLVSDAARATTSGTTSTSLLLVSDAAANSLLQLTPRGPPPPPLAPSHEAQCEGGTTTAALRAAGAIDAACLVLRVDAHARGGGDDAVRPANNTSTRHPLHSSVVLPPSTVVLATTTTTTTSAAVAAAGHARRPDTSGGSGAAAASPAGLVAALRSALWGCGAQPPPPLHPPIPFHATGDAVATAAVQQLQVQLRAHVVAYHDVAAVAAVHAQWGGRWVRAAGQPRQPATAEEEEEDSAEAEEALEAVGDDGAAPTASSSTPARAADSRALQSPFVRARSRSAASSSRLANIYADGLTRSEARFRRPSGMCALTAAGECGLVAVCDTANCMLRLLVHARALRGAPSPLLARLVPQPLLARGVAAVAACDAAVSRGWDRGERDSSMLATSFLDASFVASVVPRHEPELEGSGSAAWDAATTLAPASTGSRRRPQVPPLASTSTRAPLLVSSCSSSSSGSSSSNSTRATPRVADSAAAVRRCSTPTVWPPLPVDAAATPAAASPSRGLQRGRTGEQGAPPPPRLSEPLTASSSPASAPAAALRSPLPGGCASSLDDLAALSLDDLRQQPAPLRRGGEVEAGALRAMRGRAGAGHASTPPLPPTAPTTPLAALHVTRSPAGASCAPPAWGADEQLLPLPPSALSTPTPSGGAAALPSWANETGHVATSAAAPLRPRSSSTPPPLGLPPVVGTVPWRTAAPTTATATSTAAPPSPPPPPPSPVVMVDTFAMASLLADLRRDLSPELSAQLREVLLGGSGGGGGSGRGGGATAAVAPHAAAAADGLRVRPGVNDAAAARAAASPGGGGACAPPRGGAPHHQPQRPPPWCPRAASGFVEVSERVGRWARRGLPTQPQLASSLRRGGSSSSSSCGIPSLVLGGGGVPPPSTGAVAAAPLSFRSAHEFDASMALTPARPVACAPGGRRRRAGHTSSLPAARGPSPPPPPPPRSRAGSGAYLCPSRNGNGLLPG